MLQLLERRGRQESVFDVEERRAGVAGHQVRVGRLLEHPDWVAGECSCGETAQSKAYQLVEAWVAYHKATSAREKSTGEYALAS